MELHRISVWCLVFLGYLSEAQPALCPNGLTQVSDSTSRLHLCLCAFDDLAFVPHAGQLTVEVGPAATVCWLHCCLRTKVLCGRVSGAERAAGRHRKHTHFIAVTNGKYIHSAGYQSIRRGHCEP